MFSTGLEGLLRSILLVCIIERAYCGKFTLVPLFLPTFPLPVNGNFGTTLFLTPYIESGQVDEARNLSKVGPLPNVPVNVTSYSGFITVNKTYDSNLFFWYFPAIEVDPATAPTIVWLQGGPGWSSLYGVFMESGPYYIYDDDKVKMREWTWCKLFNVIYIDNPVGTGFSFTKKSDGYARDDEDIADNLYSAIIQLFQLFPEFRENDLYLAGESFGGKFVSTLGAKLHKLKPDNVRLAGFFLGNPLLTLEVLEWGDTLYNIGLINYEQRLHFEAELDRFQYLYQNRRFEEAGDIIFKLYFGSDSLEEVGPSYFNNATCYITSTNLVYTFDPASTATYSQYLSLPAVRRALHTGNSTVCNGSVVIEYYRDIAPVTEDFVSLMNDYKTMLYYGEMDMLITYRASEKIIRDHMPSWKHASEYRAADRVFWRTDSNDTDLAGYVTSIGRFRHVMVRGGGHLLPFDQPERTFDMVRRFILDIPFES